MGARRFLDGLMNAMTMAGSRLDPRSYNSYAFCRLSDQQTDAAFRSSWLMRKIIAKPAAEMTREGRDWQADKPTIEKLEAEEARLDLWAKLERAEVLRGLGGAAMVLYVDGDDQTTPLDQSRIRAGGLTTLHVWHRSRFTLGQPIEEWKDPWFGHPAFYRVNLNSSRGSLPVQFHPSRVVAFRGHLVPDMQTASWDDTWWGDSTVQVVKDAVDNVHTGEDGFAKLISSSHIRRIGVPKLLDMVATGEGDELLAKRMERFATGESMFGVSWFDSGDAEGNGAETITDRQMVWAGIPDIKASNLMVAAAAANMPATVLLGKSPDGMNSTGKSDTDVWRDEVKSRQDLRLRPCLGQIDAALVPSALGKPDPSVWWKFAPLSTPTEAEEATTFKTTTDAIDKLLNTGLIPDIALSKGVQNLMSERAWLPGLDEALAELPDDERFPTQAAEPKTAVPPDPSAITDARFLDATPRTLYVSRKLLNAAEFIAWAKGQGFETTTPADDLHVTIALSRTPVDWMKVGSDWGSGDAEGKLTVAAGGARIVETLGDKGAVVLLFASSPLSWRHEEIIRAGASHDFEEYQPHVTITYARPEGLDLAAVEPFRGKLVFGPEVFEEVVEDWEKRITEQ